jgi:ABC-type multidrug transport system fused ATPase/permease subunit
MNAKLDTGRVFERIFEIYGQQFTLLIPAALVLFIPVAVLDGLLYAGGGALAFLLASLIATVATFWYQGMVVEAVVDILDGRRDQTVGGLFESASPFIWPLLAAGILAGIGITIGFVLLIVPGLILLTWWAVIVPAIVIDKTGVMGSFGRSRELVRHNGWRVFGVLLVLFVLQLVLGGVVKALANGISDSFASYAIADLIVRVLLVPLSGIAATVMYVELRRIKGEPLAADAATPAPAPVPPEAPAI